MKKQYIIIIVLAGAALWIDGCKKFVDVGQPKNQLISSEVFADSADASGALAGIYFTQISNTLGLNSGGMTLYPGLSGDELVPTGTSTAIVQFYTNNILTNNSLSNGLWVGGYSYIYSANAIIEGVTNSTGIASASKARLVAEARFIRGYEYFCLVNIFGAVPLVTSTDYKTTALLARASADQVYTQIISDLQYAESNLGANTGTNDRPNSLTASAMLAKVYLYLGKSDLALAESSKVINSGNFMLEPNLSNVFLTLSAETIWQLDLPFARYTWEGLIFVPTSAHAVPRYVLNSALYNSFEAGDLRLTSWVKTNKSGTKTFNYPFKYKNNALATSATEGYVLLRLAEIYLIRAEAELNQGDLNDAISDLNLIRNRAGLANTGASDASSIFAAIQNERQHELFCEGGNRWFDLKRWNLAGAVLGSEKTTWNPNGQLYPVPVYQIDADPNLNQNPGY